MTLQTHCKIAEGRIDPAPMVDIVFLLLIFLVLSSPYVLVPGIGMLELPVAKRQDVQSFQGMVLTVTRDNLLFFNNQATTMESLTRELRAAARQSRSQELIIQIDRQVSHGMLVQLMSVALDAGIAAVNIATRPELPTTATPR
jgi:biopolymer transport protein ExbD